jgi:hypothetical protein
MVGRAARRQSFAFPEKAKQMVKRPVLEHEDDEVLEAQFWHDIPPVPMSLGAERPATTVLAVKAAQFANGSRHG